MVALMVRIAISAELWHVANTNRNPAAKACAHEKTWFTKATL